MFKKYKQIFLIIFVFTSTVQCGFKVLDKSSVLDLKITEIKTEGDKKINFLVRNKLKKVFKEEALGDAYLEIKTNKDKSIKEKNSKNEITKYEITISSSVTLNFLKTNERKTFSTQLNGSYDVSDNHSSTITNQNNLEKNLAKKTADLIAKQLILILNDR